MFYSDKNTNSIPENTKSTQNNILFFHINFLQNFIFMRKLKIINNQNFILQNVFSLTDYLRFLH